MSIKYQGGNRAIVRNCYVKKRSVEHLIRGLRLRATKFKTDSTPLPNPQQRKHSRLCGGGNLIDWWAVLVRILASTIGTKLKLTGLILRDRILSAKFAEKELSVFWDGEKYGFFGIYIPKPANNVDINELYCCVKDILFVYLFHKDVHSWNYVDKLDKRLTEGVYFYSKPEDGIDITIHSGDVVLDLGAWIGVFSVYAAKKGASVYAFEPLKETRNLLEKTVDYNKGGNGQINIVPLGVGRENKRQKFSQHETHPDSSMISCKQARDNLPESLIMMEVDMVSLDDWVDIEGIKKVDFIKADIEGFEREMLLGATNILRTHKPKLSLCTYHRPDDPEVMANIILEANPDYIIIQRNMKLFGYVPE